METATLVSTEHYLVDKDNDRKGAQPGEHVDLPHGLVQPGDLIVKNSVADHPDPIHQGKSISESTLAHLYDPK